MYEGKVSRPHIVNPYHPPIDMGAAGGWGDAGEVGSGGAVDALKGGGFQGDVVR